MFFHKNKSFKNYRATVLGKMRQDEEPVGKRTVCLTINYKIATIVPSFFVQKYVIDQE